MDASKKASGAAKAVEQKAADRAKLFEKNLDAFKRYYGSIHARLSTIQEPQTTLVFDDDGDPDIEFRGGRLYGKGARRFAEEQIEDYWRRGDRIGFAPPQTGNLDHVGANFLYKVLRRAVDAEIAFSANMVDRHGFYLIVFGIGLGPHIETLIEETQCRALLLIEPNLEFLYQSLFVFDWAALFERFDEPERRLAFCIAGNYERIFLEVRDFVRATAASFFDTTHIYVHYQNSIMDMANKEVHKDAPTFLSGLGFLEDEILMIQNSFRNLEHYEGRTYRKAKSRCDLPAFIIGCGPSLDKSLPVIKANQDKAILISCGTTLGVLLANGIVPDFQIEMENVDLVLELMKDKSEHYDLSHVCLVASTTIAPGVSDYFKKNVFFFRHSLASFCIFGKGDDSGLAEIGPTVSNAGVSFAQELGCREFYFFGVDFGSIRADRHHATQSDYRDGGKAPNTNDWDMQRPANFGGVAHTHQIFLWARATVEQSLRRYPVGSLVYNCSDGLAIEGAKPKLPKTVSITSTVDKAKELERIMGGFPEYSREEFAKAWFSEDWAKRIDDICAELTEFCSVEDPDFRERYLVKIARRLIDHSGEPSFEQLMIRGSIQMVMMAAMFYLTRVASRDRDADMEKIVREEMIAIIESLRDEATTFLSGLWQGPKPDWVE